jgi:Protein of unknown function (DUF1579)
MKIFTFLASLFLLTTSAGAVLAQEKADDKKNIYKEYMEKFGPAGPEHKLLAPLAGNYSASVKCWMEPDQSPQVSEGTLYRKSIFDGRFIQENFEGKMFDQAFHGFGMIGFDRAKKKYVMTWLDSVSTSLHMSYGTYDEGTKTWTFKNEDICPITNKPAKSRYTLRIVNGNEQQLEMFMQLGDEKEMRTMAINLARKK